ncbi:Asparagine synthetase [glutamine-hydrolyzing] [invertebrate metagenome]|uniref:Asparagine synthetase [glutamine-hydrolyzing] n=1 Tax=invertebrate metagenome TaxID=1711999 RepID=A0A484H5A6_9ZZZZ
MCGIGGAMNRDGRPVEATLLAAMTKALAHRGPDGRGRYMAGAVGLVQTRLAVIDLFTGAQPFQDTGSGTALVANAEIYNDRELRAVLRDVRFVSHSDCEPPLYLYRRHGLSFTKHLRGMYAIALHDPGGPSRCERLVLARDPFGIKPLYYTESSTGFLFASEVQALLAVSTTRPQLDSNRTAELLQLQFTTGTDCLLSGIKRVAPGEILVVEAGEVVERRRHPALSPLINVAEIRNPLAALETVLREAVELHQRSDVPYGMFLSGGVDSSALLAMMARLNEQPVLTFTACFPHDNARDECNSARAVAAAVGAESIDVPFTEADFWALLPVVVAVMDDPAADYATLPTYKLAAEAHKAVKVILSGEGGDEVFAGYGRYRSAMRPWPFTRPMRRRGLLDGLGILRQELTGWRDGLAAAERAVANHGTRLQQAQEVDCAHWLPNDLLGKLDRCLMAHGVEGRLPFLDPVLAQFAYSLSDNLKIRHGVGKWLLRRWLADALPVVRRPFTSKHGFTVPVGTWIAHRGRALGPLVAHTPAVAEWCRPAAVKALFANANRNRRISLAAWILLFHALWVRYHIDHVDTVRLGLDVFAMLEA